MASLPYALCAYGLPHRMGYLKTKAGEAVSSPMTPIGLMDAAVELGLSGVEFPLSSLVPSFDGAQVETQKLTVDIGEELRRRDLRLVADYGMILEHDAQHLRDYLALAASAGAKVVRATLSHLLCGDRRALADGWDAYMERLAARLREALPTAEALGLSLAVENHQDAGSADLVRLYEMSGCSPAYGITLDTGNPLAVGEDPVEFTRAIAPLIRHLHLKDYTLHHAPEGYRLVRCANGDGVIDFPAILDIALANGFEMLPAIEIAAQATRTIPFYEESWWACYPPTEVTGILPVLRLLQKQGIPETVPYSTAWERGENSEAVAREEWDVIRRSADYFREMESARAD